MTYFGDYLREARGSKSLSQAAAIIGCAKPHLWDLETGRSANPGLKLLDAIARAYGIPLSALAEAWLGNEATSPASGHLHRLDEPNPSWATHPLVTFHGTVRDAFGASAAKSASGPVGELEEHKALSPLVGQENEGSSRTNSGGSPPLRAAKSDNHSHSEGEDQ